MEAIHWEHLRTGFSMISIHKRIFKLDLIFGLLFIRSSFKNSNKYFYVWFKLQITFNFIDKFTQKFKSLAKRSKKKSVYSYGWIRIARKKALEFRSEKSRRENSVLIIFVCKNSCLCLGDSQHKRYNKFLWNRFERWLHQRRTDKKFGLDSRAEDKKKLAANQTHITSYDVCYWRGLGPNQLVDVFVIFNHNFFEWNPIYANMTRNDGTDTKFGHQLGPNNGLRGYGAIVWGPKDRVRSQSREPNVRSYRNWTEIYYK